MNRKLVLAITALAASFALQLNAQCKIENNYFQAGEELRYDMYFKYGLIDKKAGTSSLTTTAERYNNTDAYKMTLVAKSEGFVRSLFVLNDTLSSYMTKNLVPLAFIKNAQEGKEHTIERMTYTYGSDGVSVYTKRIKNNVLRFEETLTVKNCIYDLLSVVFYARTLNFSNMKKGDITPVQIISGRDKPNMIIEYKGIESVDANNGKSYSCIKLVLSIVTGNKDAFQDKKEAMKVYISNDNNRIPIRLDSKLKMGSTRAVLKSYKGNKYTLKSE